MRNLLSQIYHSSLVWSGLHLCSTVYGQTNTNCLLTLSVSTETIIMSRDEFHPGSKAANVERRRTRHPSSVLHEYQTMAAYFSTLRWWTFFGRVWWLQPASGLPTLLKFALGSSLSPLLIAVLCTHLSICLSFYFIFVCFWDIISCSPG